MNRHTRDTLILTVIPLGVAMAASVIAEDFEISRSTIDGGGAMLSVSGDLELSGTIGQPDAGVTEGDGFTLTGGFWFEEPSGDCNSTGSIDLLDYGDLGPCLLGPDTGVAEGCECFDVDASGTVDLLDFAIAQTGFRGS